MKYLLQGGNRWRWMTSYSLKAMVSVACLALTGNMAFANQQLDNMSHDASQWVMPHGNYNAHRYSQLTQINKGNARKLELAWQFSTGTLRGHQGAPLVVGDTMYIVTPIPNVVMALNLNKFDTGSQVPSLSDDTYGGPNDPGFGNSVPKIKWIYDPIYDDDLMPLDAVPTATIMCCDTVNRGLAYAPNAGPSGESLIILARSDLKLIAFNADTGAIVWRADFGLEGSNPNIKGVALGESNTAAPIVAGDKVYIGMAGGELGARGRMHAYYLNSGTLAWKAYTTGSDADLKLTPGVTIENGAPAASNQGIDSWSGVTDNGYNQYDIGGSTPWNWITYDEDLNMIYYGTGNPGVWNSLQRPGDNKYSISIMARDADNGDLKWVFQVVPHDEWDYDHVPSNIIFNYKGKKALFSTGKNGFAYILDAANGSILDISQTSVVTWVKRDGNGNPIFKAGAHPVFGNGQFEVNPLASPEIQSPNRAIDICPTSIGGVDHQPASYNPDMDVFFFPQAHGCMNYLAEETSYVPGDFYLGSDVEIFPVSEVSNPASLVNAVPPGVNVGNGNLGRIVAWDANTGLTKWSKDESFAVWTGVLTTKGGLVVYGTMDGYIKVRRASDGELLWQHQLPSGMVGDIMTYEHNGTQYIAAYSGMGGYPGSPISHNTWPDFYFSPNIDVEDNASTYAGAVGAFGGLNRYIRTGGTLHVFRLSNKGGDNVVLREDKSKPKKGRKNR